MTAICINCIEISHILKKQSFSAKKLLQFYRIQYRIYDCELAFQARCVHLEGKQENRFVLNGTLVIDPTKKRLTLNLNYLIITKKLYYREYKLKLFRLQLCTAVHGSLSTHKTLAKLYDQNFIDFNFIIYKKVVDFLKFKTSSKPFECQQISKLVLFSSGKYSFLNNPIACLWPYTRAPKFCLDFHRNTSKRKRKCRLARILACKNKLGDISLQAIQKPKILLYDII